MKADFERHELINLRTRAEMCAEAVPNITWQRAYSALASALDHLDAMMARSDRPCDEDKIEVPL